MKIKLVATDMDGTLLNTKKEMPADFQAWVLAHPHIRTVIASGRQYYTLEKDFKNIRDSLTFIAENGALVFEKGKIIYKEVMENKDVRLCLDRIGSMPTGIPIVCGAKSAYAKKIKDEEFQQNAAMYYEHLEYVDDLYEVIGKDDIAKIAIYYKKEMAEEAFREFDALPPNMKAVLSGNSWIDIAEKNVNKGRALGAIQKQHAITKKESMAFGDYLNDLQLLMQCDESYCMENGHADLKKIAKYITAANDDDGVMQVLRTIA